MLFRIFEYSLAIMLLIVLGPLLLIAALLIYIYDRHNPFYIAPRVGKDGKLFNMIKLRSMVIDANKIKVDSTANDDKRITPIGKWVRKFKIDELGQLINVIKGDMTIVGPRPQVMADVNRYTDIEKGILIVKPGITDISSIVFADEGDILEGKENPDLAYNQLIRPWKSRLALLYIKNRSIILTIYLIFFTLTNVFARQWTLRHLSYLVLKLKGSDNLLAGITQRSRPLAPYPPPGSTYIVAQI